MKYVFPIIKNPYDLRNETEFNSRNVHTVRYGIETASFIAPRIWSSIPRGYKECSFVNEFKAKIKLWYPKLPIETLQKLHLSNRLYIEQVICHLLMLLLSARARSKTVRWNSVRSEIPCSGSSFLWKPVN